MKKILFAAAAVFLIMAMPSCKKEGVFNPKQKIEHIYSSSKTITSYEGVSDTSVQPRYLTESWDWDDDLLTKIDYYDVNGSVGSSEYFSYEKNRLVRVDCPSMMEYTTITYDGRKVKQMDTYSNNQHTACITFEYDGKKLSTTTYHYFSSNKALALPATLARVMNFTTSELYAKQLEQMMRQADMRGAKSDDEAVLCSTWDGDNLKCQEFYQEGSLMAKWEMQYDNKKNPYYGWRGTLDEENYSKNNETQIVYTVMLDGETSTDTENYSYTYNSKDYPATRTESLSQSFGSCTVISTQTYEYEYDD